jgi:hypothetical protein
VELRNVQDANKYGSTDSILLFTVPVFPQIHIIFIRIGLQKKTQSFSESIFLRPDTILNGTDLCTQSCKIMLNYCKVQQLPTDPLKIKNL